MRRWARRKRAFAHPTKIKICASLSRSTRNGRAHMARRKAASRTAAQPAVKKKWTGLRNAAKPSARKAIKSKGRTTTAKPKARPKQRIAISHHREEDFRADG